jgi:hypothetical protein
MLGRCDDVHLTQKLQHFVHRTVKAAHQGQLRQVTASRAIVAVERSGRDVLRKRIGFSVDDYVGWLPQATNFI